MVLMGLIFKGNRIERQIKIITEYKPINEFTKKNHTSDQLDMSVNLC